MEVGASGQPKNVTFKTQEKRLALMNEALTNKEEDNYYSQKYETSSESGMRRKKKGKWAKTNIKRQEWTEKKIL